MALVNPNIAMGYRGIEIPNQLAQYAQVQQIQNAQNQNRLAGLQMQEYERARGEEEGLRNYLSKSDLTKPEGRAGLLQYGKTGREYVKTLTEQDSAAATLANTKSQTSERDFKLSQEKLKHGWSSLGDASTPQEAADKILDAVKKGHFDQATADRALAEIPQDPAQFKDYRMKKLVGILDANDKLKAMMPKVVRQEAGGQILTIQDNPMQPGYGLPIEGREIAKTMTPGEIASNKIAQGQLGVAQQRLAQEAQGVTYQQDAQGNIVALPSRLSAGGVPTARPVTGQDGAPVKGKPSAFAEKAAAQRTQMGKDLDFAIKELGDITKDGGLIDQSTGSGAGRLADIGMSFVGQATPGAIAIGKIDPIADLALKMVPRFEGPQSDKDTASYKAAAGQLADPTLPTKIRKEAGKTVLRLMQQRKNQFATNEMAAEGIAPAANAGKPAAASNIIVTPDGQSLTFPNAAAAAQFKKAAGL